MRAWRAKRRQQILARFAKQLEIKKLLAFHNVYRQEVLRNT